MGIMGIKGHPGCVEKNSRSCMQGDFPFGGGGGGGVGVCFVVQASGQNNGPCFLVNLILLACNLQTRFASTFPFLQYGS